MGEDLLPVGGEETVAFEVAVDAGDEQAIAQGRPLGVDALAAGDPDRTGPLVHAIGDDDGLGQGSGTLGPGE